MHRAPTRTCVACRTSRGKRELVRIVRTPDGRMMMDTSGRLAGRGAYLCDDPACRRIALDKNILTRALHVPLPDELRSALQIAQIPEQTTTPGGTIGQE